jgi:hypothetical protein
MGLGGWEGGGGGGGRVEGGRGGGRKRREGADVMVVGSLETQDVTDMFWERVETRHRRDEGGFWAVEGEDCGGGGEGGGDVGGFFEFSFFFSVFFFLYVSWFMFYVLIG